MFGRKKPPAGPIRSVAELHPELPRPCGNIQYKASTVCLELYCDCGWQGCYQGDFAYQVRCKECGAVYETGANVPMTKLNPAEIARLNPGSVKQPADMEDNNEYGMSGPNDETDGTLLQKLQDAAKLLEQEGLAAHPRLRLQLGGEVALTLVVAYLRAEYGATKSYPSDPAIEEKVREKLKEHRIYRPGGLA